MQRSDITAKFKAVPSAVREKVSERRAKQRAKRLVIDGVDWTLTERRYRRKCMLEMLGSLVFTTVFVVVAFAIIGDLDESAVHYIIGLWVGALAYHRNSFREGKGFGRIFQRQTGSEGFTEVPKEPRPSRIHRARAKVEG